MRKRKKDIVKKQIGRPTSYNATRVLKLTREYIDSCEDKEELVPAGGKLILRTIVKLPTIEGLSEILNISVRQIHTWKDKYDDFRPLHDKLVAKQSRMLLENGLSGKYNHQIAKLILSSRHGYVEKQKLQHEGKITQDYDEDQIQAIAERVRNDGGSKSKRTSN